MSRLLQSLPTRKQWGSNVTSRFSSTRFISSWSNSAISESSYKKRRKAEYKDLEAFNARAAQRDFPMTSMGSIRHLIYTGDANGLEENDGIHLHYRLDQESRLNEPERGQSSKV